MTAPGGARESIDMCVVATWTTLKVSMNERHAEAHRERTRLERVEREESAFGSRVDEVPSDG